VDQLPEKIFTIGSEQEFNDLSLKIFRHQYLNNPVYRQYVDYIRIAPASVKHYSAVPFLPIEFFKSHQILTGGGTKSQQVFVSSGTTNQLTSSHYIADVGLYEESFLEAFNYFYGSPEQYILLALLPSYLERGNSSLIYMVEKLIKKTGHPASGFYLRHNEQLLNILQNHDRKVILLGVTFALLDLAEQASLRQPDLIIIETGGMKGRRKELVREEVHRILCKAFHVNVIHSEYGMTELLSQAYSKGNGLFYTPPWMKVLVRDVNDPLSLTGHDKTGGLNIIDLANVHSCSFIATQDLGKSHSEGSFEVLGRFDSSDIRGCNLMVE
jgi:phenylacetate-coenzyme A ligase PaaK-like adenylate-forming protein